jgi:large conductance mechanosensitive channel
MSSDTIVQIQQKEKQSGFKNVTGAVSKNALKSVKAVGNVWDDFKNFLNRGNVVDLAVGIVIGAAFTSVVNSLVADIFTPVIALAGGSSFDNLFFVLKCPRSNVTGTQIDCGAAKTVAQAKSLGIVTMNYGAFLTVLINFLIVSVIVFFLVKAYAAAFRREEPKEVTTKECPYCCKEIPLSATKCAFCTSTLAE